MKRSAYIASAAGLSVAAFLLVAPFFTGQPNQLFGSLLLMFAFVGAIVVLHRGLVGGINTLVTIVNALIGIMGLIGAGIAVSRGAVNTPMIFLLLVVLPAAINVVALRQARSAHVHDV